MKKMLINGDWVNHIDATDRALQYGDGLFETVAIHDGEVQLWEQHIRRLKMGCQRLGINNVCYTQLAEEAAQLCQDMDQAILKIIISRGKGGRGYRFNTDENHAVATRILSIHPSPNFPESHYNKGIELRLCQLKMGRTPALAGIKHLNRLEQVMARSEWQDEQVFEGLMRDDQNNIIEGTMSNFFIVKNGRLLTSDLSHCGVAGIVRQLIVDDELNHQLAVDVTQISEEQLNSADELFICNSVIGIMPVKAFIKQSYIIGPLTKRIINKFADYSRQAENHGFK